jgi:hypothetical protein
MTKSEQKIESMIQEIMENFEWNRCAYTMKMLNWTWGFNNLVPQVEDLKNTAKYLIGSAIKGALESKDLRPDEVYLSSTGGLKASVTKNRYNHINYINLEFILTDWSSDGD